jgi:hypothetical protein
MTSTLCYAQNIPPNASSSLKILSSNSLPILLNLPSALMRLIQSQNNTEQYPPYLPQIKEQTNDTITT